MRGTELLYKMELIDPVFVEAAEAAPQRARSKRLMWGSLAACFFLKLVQKLMIGHDDVGVRADSESRAGAALFVKFSRLCFNFCDAVVVFLHLFFNFVCFVKFFLFHKHPDL